MILKQVPEDFIVREVADVKLGQGKFSYFMMKKRLWNTLDAVSEIAKRLNVDVKRIRFAGIKDRQAVTQQYVSAENVPRVALENLSIKDIEIEYLGQSNERMHTGLLRGNEFNIVVRDISSGLKANEKVPNYFDDQRFGNRKTNHLVGKALLHKDFAKACELMEFEVEGNDYVNALKKKMKLVKLCFNAYQSYLFNLVLDSYIRKNYEFKEAEYSLGKLAFPSDKVKDFSIPLLQFDTEIDGELKDIYDKVLENEGIARKDFVIRQFPGLLQSTEEREAFVAVHELELGEVLSDDLNPGRKKQTVSFFLDKGSYATIVIKALSLFRQDLLV